jgi:Protein of unknown function (DUF2738)
LELEMREEQQKLNLRRNIFKFVSNGRTITLLSNTMQSYQLSEIDEKEIAFTPPRRSGNGYMMKVFLKKEGQQVPLLIQSPTVADEKQDTPKNWCLCFGTKTWENQDRRKANSHTTGIVIQRADNPTAHQTQWINDYKEKIVKTCAIELVRIKDAIRKPTLTLTSDSLTSASFSRLEEKSGDSILNLKIRDVHDSAMTEFIRYPSLEHIPAAEMTGKKCNVKFEILVDGIFVGANGITMQVKLDRACVAEAKKAPVVRKPMRITVVPDDEVHEMAGIGENEVEIPAEEEESDE